MIADLPGNLMGANPLVNWLNRLKTAIRKRTLLSGLGYKVRYSESGTVLEILPGGGSRAALQMFRVKSVSGEALVCRSWDGTNEGSADVKIAKAFNARNPASEVIGGVTVTYTYGSGADVLNFSRQAVGTGINERQMIVPYYLLNGLIAAGAIDFSGVDDEGNDLKLIEISARCWAGPAL